MFSIRDLEIVSSGEAHGVDWVGHSGGMKRGWEDYDGLMVGERRPSGKNLGSIGAISYIGRVLVRAGVLQKQNR